MTFDHPDATTATPDPTAARGGTLVRFRGTGGSIPSPGPSTARYGGNTPCVEVRVGETVPVLDAGTGLPFFAPMHLPSARLEIVAPADKDGSVATGAGSGRFGLAAEGQEVHFPTLDG
jgi:hypothetical protein